MLQVAPTVSVHAEALLQLLFTTGVRIGAVSHLRWSQVRTNDDLAKTTTVLEKGGQPRILLLTQSVRDALHRLYQLRGTLDPRVFPVSVRHLRNLFYRSCQAAGMSGPHCHPHTARHTVAHALFHAGNPLALIAKYLGHRTLATTNNYYLRLSFKEIMDRIQLPWPL